MIKYLFLIVCVIIPNTYTLAEDDLGTTSSQEIQVQNCISMATEAISRDTISSSKIPENAKERIKETCEELNY